MLPVQGTGLMEMGEEKAPACVGLGSQIWRLGLKASYAGLKAHHGGEVVHVDVEGGGRVDGAHDPAHVQRLVAAVVEAQHHVNLCAPTPVSTRGHNS